MMLKRLTLCSQSQEFHACQAFGGAYACASELSNFDNDTSQANCPVSTDWSTLRRHRSLNTLCSARETALVAYSAGTAQVTADAPGQGALLPVRSTVRMADCAGWTEVVIPRGFNDLFDLPVGLLSADANTRNGHRLCPAISLGYGAGDGGADDRWGPEDQSVGFSQPNTLQTIPHPRVPRFKAVGGISCQNNNEVTL